MKMEQMIENLPVELRIDQEEIKPSQEEMQARIRTNQEQMGAKIKAMMMAG
jgi:hypothetical protein